ncbi:E3 ubiquitin-protein ligase bre1-like [Coccinella septempunctata]|uniref:E3 ubiquitin-protein ligase bre1-like n=1 Tax=Coccinella septempunctata TaxID=41139 RepID=UPI001D07A96E|nr:E3 ubiquitin-protein ligase bre1-like [Coccinella septempunctata]
MPRATRSRRRRSQLSGLAGFLNFLEFGFPFDLPTDLTDSPPARRRRANTKKTTSEAPQIPQNINNSVIVLDDSDDECLSTVVSRSRTINENACSKVDSFFKSSGLLSDDEDDVLPSSTTTSNDAYRNSAPSKPCSSLIEESIAKSAGNENVIDADGEVNELSTMEDIKNYCKETEDILKNANAILEKFTGSKTQETQEVVKNKELVNKENESKDKGLGECPICYESFSEKQVVTTKCGHLFCKICIERVATTVKKCPTCRKAVNKKNIIPIYI